MYVESRPQFLLSNLSMNLPLMLAGSTADYERYVCATDADGLEITPVRSRFMANVLNRAIMLEETLAHRVPIEGRDYLFEQLGYDVRKDWSQEDAVISRLLHSQHSSFRQEVGDNGPAARLFPTWEQSLQHMKLVQGITDSTLPAVVYPIMGGNVVSYDNRNAPFADRTIQPKASDWQRMGLGEHAPLTDIKAAFARQGFTGTTFDVFHCHDFKNPPELAARLAAGGLVHGVHLAINRLDMVNSRSPLGRRTHAAKQAFMHSAHQASKTAEGELLQIIASEWKNNPAYSRVMKRVVLEDGPSDPRRFMPGRTTRDHTAILAHAKELVADA